MANVATKQETEMMVKLLFHLCGGCSVDFKQIAKVMYITKQWDKSYTLDVVLNTVSQPNYNYSLDVRDDFSLYVINDEDE